MSKEKEKVGSKKKIGVKVEIPPIIVEIEDVGTTKEKMLAAKEAVKRKLEQSFPACGFSIVPLGVLDFTTVEVGMVVVDNNKPRVGVVTAINRQTINVGFKGGTIAQGPPECFSRGTAKIEELCNFPDEGDTELYEGNVGYIRASGGKDVLVVVVSTRGKSYKVVPTLTPGNPFANNVSFSLPKNTIRVKGKYLQG